MEYISKHTVLKIKHCKAKLYPWFMAYHDSSRPTQSEDGSVSHFTAVLSSVLLPIPMVTLWDVTPSLQYYLECGPNSRRPHYCADLDYIFCCHYI